MVIFKSKRKKLNDTEKIKLSGKRIYPTASVKYVGVKIDQHLTWQHHINDLFVKLNRANALLFKIRKFVDDKILRPIYFAIFESNLNYCSLVWDQNYNAINLLVILQHSTFFFYHFFYTFLFNNWLFFPLIHTNLTPHGQLMINSKNIHTELTLMVKIRSL